MSTRIHAPGRGVPVGLLALAALSIAVVGGLDYFTGPKLGFFLFYFAPVSLVAWRGNRREALLTALACALTWQGIERGTSPAEASTLWWNTAIRLSAFCAIALTVSRIADLLQREKTLNTALSASMERVKLLSGLVPICGSCKSIRNDRGYWQRLEEYIEAHSEAAFSHGICPKCLERIVDEPEGRGAR